MAGTVAYVATMTTINDDFFDDDTLAVARRMIGARFAVEGVGGTIVETEAYTAADPASHSFRGKTQRNAAMFETPGTIYVYRSYGIHWCVNIVCRPGSAVLIRALAPTDGAEIMMERRGLTDLRKLCGGPGCLTQALSIDRSHNGMRVSAPPFAFDPAPHPVPILSGPRIGISKAIERPWRFGLEASPYLSRPMKANDLPPA